MNRIFSDSSWFAVAVLTPNQYLLPDDRGELGESRDSRSSSTVDVSRAALGVRARSLVPSARVLRMQVEVNAKTGTCPTRADDADNRSLQLRGVQR